ncbi:uncharacterized protein LOC142626971 isoform X2 [Castanea sativa]|uniref:uncharacterized protein LOC142626971 isoform X2 n=1 Tax=Castanea sativa TaxID=21020 RepID=UPI003F64CC39
MSRELVMMVTWQRSGLLKNISTQSASLISLKHPASKHVEQIEELHPNMVVQDAGSCNLYIYACLVMSLIGSLLTMLVGRMLKALVVAAIARLMKLKMKTVLFQVYRRHSARKNEMMSFSY